MDCAPFSTPFEAVVKWDLSHSRSSLFRVYHGGSVILTAVRTLKLGGGHDGSSATIDTLTLPSLRALNYDTDDEVGKLLKFFLRSSPPLTFLGLRGESTREDSVLPILRLLPALQGLRYENAFVSVQIFRELAVGAQDIPSSSDHTVCLSLNTAFFGGLRHVDPISDCAEAWKSMLRSRAKVNKAFERVYVNIDIEHATLIDVSEIEAYTASLEYCFDDCEGALEVGEFRDVFATFFPLSLYV